MITVCVNGSLDGRSGHSHSTEKNLQGLHRVCLCVFVCEWEKKGEGRDLKVLVGIVLYKGYGNGTSYWYIYLPMLRTLTHLPHPFMRPVYEQPVVTRAIDNNRFVLKPSPPPFILDNRSHVRQLLPLFSMKNPSLWIHFKSTTPLLQKVLYLLIHNSFVIITNFRFFATFEIFFF